MRHPGGPINGPSRRLFSHTMKSVQKLSLQQAHQHQAYAERLVRTISMRRKKSLVKGANNLPAPQVHACCVQQRRRRPSRPATPPQDTLGIVVTGSSFCMPCS
eukprot:GHVR01054258.1.p1 GENE.GHVR01054258.1~~GHVR01054258.1.p1  ORF type:complete len:103 (-),score=6.24 GHVR01054258.1:197-505(-)